MPVTSPQLDEARQIVREFTLLAIGTGAIPVPTASVALVLENATMFGVVGACLGTPVTVESVLGSLGVFTTLNMAGRALFIEGAKLLGWATGPFGLGGLCVLGGATAGGQTWALGQLAIAIGRNGGKTLSTAAAKQVLNLAMEEFTRGTWKAERVSVDR